MSIKEELEAWKKNLALQGNESDILDEISKKVFNDLLFKYPNHDVKYGPNEERTAFNISIDSHVITIPIESKD